MQEKEKWFVSEVIEVADNYRRVRVEIPAEVVIMEMEKILSQVSSRAKIPGFRVGKAPRDLVRRTFASEIREKLISRLVPQALSEALKKHQLNPAVEPVISDFSWQEGKPLGFQVKVDVWPEFKLPDYRSLKVSSPPVEVKDEDIEQALASLQQRLAEFVPVTERGLAPGDFAILEIKTKDLTTKKLGPTRKVQYQVGHPQNDPVLEGKIKDMKPAETRTFIVEYPNDYPNRSMAGRAVEYRVKILAIREKKIPEVNDEMARSLGSFDNLEQLKQRVKEELLAKKREEGRRAVVSEILDKIRDQVSIPLPEAAVEEEKRALLERWLASRPDGKWPQDEVNALETEARRQAEKNLKERLILEKVAQNEGIGVEEAEVEEELRSLAKENRLSVFELKEKLEKEGRMAALRHNLILRKAVDFLVNQAL